MRPCSQLPLVSRRTRTLVAVIMVTAAAQLPTALAAQGQFQFTASVQTKLSPRGTPARVSDEADSVLAAAGYARIGELYMARANARRDSAGVLKRLCGEAARRGGDVVHPTSIDLLVGDTVRNQVCERWTMTPVSRYQCVAGKGCRNVTDYVRSCASTKWVEEPRLDLVTRTSVWRYDTALARTQAETARAEAAARARADAERSDRRQAAEAAQREKLSFDARVRSGDTAAVKERLQKDPAAAQFDIAYAAEAGDVRTVRLFLDLGLAPEQSVTFYAAAHGRVEVLRLLLDRGLKPDWAAVVAAASSLKPDALSLLLERGAPTSDPSGTQASALHYAAAVSSPGDDAYDGDSNGPIGPTAEQGKTIAVLLTHGVSVDAAAPHGSTPLTWAAARGRTEAVRILLTAGANPNAQSNRPYPVPTLSHGLTPLGVAVDMAGEIQFERVVDPERVRHVLELGYQETVRLLIAAGADRNARTADGSTVLELARHLPLPRDSVTSVRLVHLTSDAALVRLLEGK